MYTFSDRQEIRQNLDKVFEFFEKPENLSDITPGWLSFKIINTGPSIMKTNAEFNYIIKLFGMPVKWKTKITEYVKPEGFVDEQVKGPFKKWIHTHSFKPVKDGVIMEDHVSYDLYGGFLKNIINTIFVSRSVKSIFNYRKKIIQEIFPGEESK